MDLGIPLLEIKIMLESNPPKSHVSREIGRIPPKTTLSYLDSGACVSA